MVDALTRFLEKAEDHYWDSFEQDRKVILSHINEIAMMVRKEIYDEAHPTEPGEGEMSPLKKAIHKARGGPAPRPHYRY